MIAATWTPPPIWSVPLQWPGSRIFVLCGGSSLREQRPLVSSLPHPIIAVKEGVHLRPDADVAFFAGERPDLVAPNILRNYYGPTIVVRGKGHRVFPPTSKRVGRETDHRRWSDDPTTVAGYDAGTSAINLAMHFGAVEIVLLGYDMQGGRWFHNELHHFNPFPKESDFLTHLSVLPDLAKDAERKGVRIINTSPTTRAVWFEFQPLKEVLARAA